MIKIYPSLISANLLQLEKVVKTLEPYCNGFHIDIMDDHFVPNLTWGAMFANAFTTITQKPLFVHLMVTNPDQFLEKLTLRPIDIFCFHIETTKEPEKLINRIKEKNWLSGVALNPNTPLSEIFLSLSIIDQALLMSVNPGFSGQQFLPDSLNRLDELAQYKKERNLDFEIVMDGGINKSNIGQLTKKGATQFGIASAIFDSTNPIDEISQLREAAK